MSRSFMGLLISGFVFCLIACKGALADVVPSSPKELSERATHIVSGRLTKLEIKEEPGSSGYTDLAIYYTLDVKTVHKGVGVKPGDKLVVRAWRWKERGRNMVGSSGHSPLPAIEQEVRVYCVGDNVILPNGFAPDREDLDSMDEHKSFQVDYTPMAQATPDSTFPSVAGFVVVALVGVVAIIALWQIASRNREPPQHE